MREAAGWLERCPALAHAALASVKATNPNRRPERTAERLRMFLPSTVSCVHHCTPRWRSRAISATTRGLVACSARAQSGSQTLSRSGFGREKRQRPRVGREAHLIPLTGANRDGSGLWHLVTGEEARHDVQAASQGHVRRDVERFGSPRDDGPDASELRPGHNDIYRSLDERLVGKEERG